MPYESLSARRQALAAADAKGALFQREPPLHVLVSRWLALGWTVDPEILEEAAQARTAERLSLKDPLPDPDIAELIDRLAADQRRYARWLWKKCATMAPEHLDSTLNSMFMGPHYANLMGADEVLDALGDLVRWRMHYNDFEAEESYAWT